MSNIFLTDDIINEKYDLKGSWVNRNATPPQDGRSATCSYCNQQFIFHRVSYDGKSRIQSLTSHKQSTVSLSSGSGKGHLESMDSHVEKVPDTALVCARYGAH